MYYAFIKSEASGTGNALKKLYGPKERNLIFWSGNFVREYPKSSLE
jgi:hypothetical protein